MDPRRRVELVAGKVARLSAPDTKTLLMGAASALANEPRLVRMPPGRVLIVGDTHGDWSSSKAAYEAFLEYGCKRLVFLGDYVDRGNYQVDNVNFVLYLKLLHRYKVVLLRGNHELRQIHDAYGFREAVRAKLGSKFLEIYDLYGFAFSHMSFAAICADGTLCAHGGIPRGIGCLEDLETSLRDELRDAWRGAGRAPHPAAESSSLPPVAFQLVWNDPKDGISGFKPNKRRGPGAYYYGRDALEEFLGRCGLKRLVRSHEPVSKKNAVAWDGKLVTVFSSKSYSARHAPAALLLETDGSSSWVDLKLK
ncbi:MAG: metallophosphoesterase [Promethearchaeota archaeon]